MAGEKKGLSYAAAGVDIDAGNALVEHEPAAKATNRPGVVAGLGGLAACSFKAAGFQIPCWWRRPTGSVRSCERDRYGAGGYDRLVAMCVNDLVAKEQSHYFLDYFATGSLNVDQAARIIEGVARGVKHRVAHYWGETAEMPGMYEKGDFDLAGFAVGAMERGQGLPDGVVGDVLLGLPSNGVHSNGYSLVRKIVELLA